MTLRALHKWLSLVIGLQVVIWVTSGMIISLLAESPDSLKKMVLDLEGMDNLSAIQILLDEDVEGHYSLQLVQAALGKTPVIVQLSPSLVSLLMFCDFLVVYHLC